MILQWTKLEVTLANAFSSKSLAKSLPKFNLVEYLHIERMMSQACHRSNNPPASSLDG